MPWIGLCLSACASALSPCCLGRAYALDALREHKSELQELSELAAVPDL